MIIKNCSVEGIERIEGNRKSDGRPFAFWKLHLTTEFPLMTENLLVKVIKH